MKNFRKGNYVMLAMVTAVATFLFIMHTVESRTASHIIGDIDSSPVYSESISSGENVNIRLSWFYQKQHSLDISVPKASFDAYVQKERKVGPHSKKYFKTFMTPYDATVEAMATELMAISQAEGYTKEETVVLVSRMVQSIPYQKDEKSFGVSQYIQYPQETLVYNRGDCEDTAILAASILQKMGYDVKFAYMSNPTGEDHLALAVHVEHATGRYVEEDGKKYFYVETVGPQEGKTVKERPIGTVPKQFAAAKMSLIAVA